MRRWLSDAFPVRFSTAGWHFHRGGEPALYLARRVVHFLTMVFTRKNLDWWCARGILFLVLAMIVFAPLAFGAVHTWAFLIVQGMAAGVFVLWLARLWLDRNPKLLWPPLAWAVAAFALYAVARYFTADIEYAARLELIQVLLFAFLFLAVVNNLRGQDEAEIITGTLIALAAATSSYAVAQFVNHSDHVWNLVSGNVGRASGTYISPNNFASFLELILPLALAFLLVGRISIVTRILLGYTALTIVAGLAVTLSRGGWVATAAGVFLVLGILLGHRNHRLRAVLLLAVLLAGSGIFTSLYLSKTHGYMQHIKSPDPAGPGVLDVSSRLNMWNAAVRMWQDHFWWGVGPAHYDYRFREYRPESIQLRPDRAHNDYLNLLADWGAAGGVIVFAGIGIFIFGLVKTWPHVRREENDFGTGQSNRFAFFLGAAGGLAALAIHSALDYNLHVPANALVGVVLLALVASNLRFATERHWFRATLPAKLALTAALGAVTVYFAAQEWRLGGEARWLATAEQQPNFSPERAAALARAFACEPGNFQTAYDLGECFRTQSFDGGENYSALAQQAMDWYARGIRLNPLDGYNYLRTGMCLDWLGRTAESGEFYTAAEARDPNGYFMIAYIGWHFVQTGDYAAARQWFARSLKLSSDNQIARNYLFFICEPKLADKAAGRIPLRPAAGGKGD